MLLNQTDVVVDEHLEKAIIPIDSSPLTFYIRNTAFQTHINQITYIFGRNADLLF